MVTDLLVVPYRIPSMVTFHECACMHSAPLQHRLVAILAFLGSRSARQRARESRVKGIDLRVDCGARTAVLLTCKANMKEKQKGPATPPLRMNGFVDPRCRALATQPMAHVPSSMTLRDLCAQSAMAQPPSQSPLPRPGRPRACMCHHRPQTQTPRLCVGMEGLQRPRLARSACRVARLLL